MRRLYRAPAKPARATRGKRQSTTMSATDIASLPQHIQDMIGKADRPKSKQNKFVPKPGGFFAKPENPDCVDPIFKTSRAPGSKILRHRRSQVQPYYTFEDRLARTNVIGHSINVYDIDDVKLRVNIWACVKQLEQEDVNLHLIDYDAPQEEPDIHYIVKIQLLSSTSETSLIDTLFGRVCPNCKTNEFIKSDLTNMPTGYRDANWRRKEAFGEFCQQCRCSSK